MAERPQEHIMEITAPWSALGSALLDDVPVWAVALAPCVVALVALMNALDMFLDTDVPIQ